MAQIRKPPNAVKLYRHFALVTVVLAMALAFVTGGGESGDAVHTAPLGSQAAARPASTPTPRPSATPAYGQAQLVNSGGGGSFGDEAGPGSGTAIGRSRQLGPVNATDLPPANSENAGFTLAYLNALSDEELENLLTALREGGVTDDAERRRVSMVMEAASRRRSGQQPRQE